MADGRGDTGGIGTTVANRLARTLSASVGTARKPRARLVLLSVTLVYLGTFLWLLEDLVIDRGAGFGIEVLNDPIGLAFQPGPGPYTHEAMAIVDLGVATWFLSPLNLLLAVGISLLVGLNIALSFLAVTQPKSCGVSASAGIVASVPALLAGTACCAPLLLLVLGIQAGGLFLLGFTLLLPAGAVLLLGTLVYLAGQVDPTMFGSVN